MGGGDLNQKKSWHPHTIKNQERVWKAEQAEAAEKRRMTELQREIQEERNREELTRHGQESGVLHTDGLSNDKKLDWMYKGPGHNVNREDYLLGRSVDKSFEQLQAAEKESVVSSGAPKNHVEHECIPFSIRSYQNAPAEQVDMARKLQEDPLVAIRKREIESRQQLLHNPVKLKELHRILKEEKLNKKNEKKCKKDKKHKKKNKRSKSKHKDSDLDDDKDLDTLLAEKYNKLKGTLEKEDEGTIDINSLLSLKYKKLSEQLGKSKKRKHQYNSSESESDESDDKKRSKKDTKIRDHRYVHNKKRDASHSPEKGKKSENKDKQKNHDHLHGDTHDRRKKNSTGRYKDRQQNETKGKKSKYRHEGDSNSKNSELRGQNSKAAKPLHARNDDSHSEEIISNRNSTNEKRPIEVKYNYRNPDNPNIKLPNNQKHKIYIDSDDERDSKALRNYGLVSADGNKLKMNSSFLKEFETKPKKAETKNEWSKPARKKLTEEEIETKRREMLQNAEWRDKERASNVKRYKEEDKKEKDTYAGNFDPDFLKKQLSKAANQGSVEARIKANINNIQRSGRAMDSNFAKR